MSSENENPKDTKSKESAKESELRVNFSHAIFQRIQR